VKPEAILARKPVRRPQEAVERARSEKPPRRKRVPPTESVFENVTDAQAVRQSPGLVLPSDPSPPSAPPLVLPMIALGLLLVGGSTISARRIPWPAIATQLDAHRVELAVGGAAAVVFALLWLNVAVLF
jgi:hypothetical protein